MTSPLSSSSKPRRLSPFFRDLASPIAAHHHRTTTTTTTRLASTTSWRDSAAPSDPPPPPAFTLDDRPDHSPESLVLDFPSSPSPPQSPAVSKSRTPLSPRTDRRGSLSPTSSFVSRSRGEGSGGGGVNGGWKTPDSSTSWMATLRVGEDEREKRAGSPVDGVVEQGVVMALSRPGNVSRLELPEDGLVNGGCDGEAWITVFGFAPGDTNLVLREFEKCGVILKHIPGPKDSNWTHILYQNHYDARKALEKNGMYLSNLLVIGVKSVDPVHRRLLSDMANNSHRGGFIPSKLVTQHSLAATSSSGTHPRTGTSAITDSGRRPTGAVAAPARSVVSKVMDLVFGI